MRRPTSEDASSRDRAHVGSRINLEAVMAQPDALDPRAVERAVEPAEAALLRLLMRYPSRFRETAQKIDGDPFETTPARELWKALTDQLIESGEAWGQTLTEGDLAELFELPGEEGEVLG